MMCDVKPVFVKVANLLACTVIVLLLTATPAVAQIDQKSHDDHKQQRKKFIKEAGETEAQYKNTHLNINSYTFKIGESGRKRAKRDERTQFQFNEAGEPVKKKGLFGKKKKKKRSN